MQAFLLEWLHPTGWRRTGQLFWRLSDAERECRQAIDQHEVRGARVLPVRVSPDAVLEIIADTQEGALHDG